jgi:hypothetical protein
MRCLWVSWFLRHRHNHTRALFADDISHPDRLVELGISDLTTIDSYAGTVELIVELTPDWAHPELAEPTHLPSR